MAEHDERNRHTRERMERLSSQLDEDQLGRRLGEHWTVAAGFLHLAFWDRFVVQRWQHATANGLAVPAPIEDHAEDLVNETLTPLLLQVPVDHAIGQALEAARAAEDLIARLPAEKVEAVERMARPRLVDRSIHRAEHLDEIEAVLATKPGT